MIYNLSIRKKGIHMKKKNINFFFKAIVYIAILAVVFLVTVLGTKYYFYDSDYAVKKTDLSDISIDGIRIGMNINEIDTSKYTTSDEIIDKCKYQSQENDPKIYRGFRNRSLRHPDQPKHRCRKQQHEQ